MGRINWKISEGVKKEDILSFNVINSRRNIRKKTQKISGVNVSAKREKDSGILTLFGKKERITLDLDLEFL